LQIELDGVQQLVARGAGILDVEPKDLAVGVE
jgi:hypothetical protein